MPIVRVYSMRVGSNLVNENDVMEQYAGGFADTYFWFKLYTNDQNDMSTRDFEWFGLTFRNSLRDIVQVLLVLSHWDDPTRLRRAWCLYEIHNALQISEIGFTVYRPECEIEQLSLGGI